jgi:hypothetical protein
MSRRSGHVAAIALAGWAMVGAAHAEILSLPQGLSVELPEGWSVDGRADGVESKTGLRRVQLVCGTQACQQTQETCTILMRQKPIEGAGDAEKLKALYASPFDRYLRIRAVLRATSRDAELRQPLEIARFGDQDWYRVETDARHNFKSGLFAETVLDGLYVGAICKTCETGEIRHRGGEAIISSLRLQSARTAGLR